ncbi:MAG TPA: riboflavin synthase [Burkholderiaceae bacterium]|nr:riboflavin synthase [Burkholderiaceae bacterium]
MFTGIITAVGQVASVEPLGPDASHGKRLTIAAPSGYLDDVALGDSIALNGACMTVTSIDPAAGRFTVDISSESLRLTASLDRTDARINLEKASRAHDRLGGHIVSGHVDGLGWVSHFAPVGESWELRVRAPRDLARYLAYKGSIAVNGVSLTVNRVVDDDEGCEFSINLIPHTIENTALGDLAPAASVNLEVDLIARYVARMLEGTAGSAPAAG